jgi:hypothetical protein
VIEYLALDPTDRQRPPHSDLIADLIAQLSTKSVSVSSSMVQHESLFMSYATLG